MALEWREVRGVDRDGEKQVTYFLFDSVSGRVYGYVDPPLTPAEFTYAAHSYGESATRRYTNLDAAKERLEYVAAVESYTDAQALSEGIKFKRTKKVTHDVAFR